MTYKNEVLSKPHAIQKTQSLHFFRSKSPPWLSTAADLRRHGSLKRRSTATLTNRWFQIRPAPWRPAPLTRRSRSRGLRPGTTRSSCAGTRSDGAKAFRTSWPNLSTTSNASSSSRIWVSPMKLFCAFLQHWKKTKWHFYFDDCLPKILTNSTSLNTIVQLG